MPGGLEAKGNCIVFPTHMLYPLQPTAFRTRCLLAGPLVAALQPHTRPGTLPVTRPGLPPRVSGGRDYGPTQHWPLLILFREVLECPHWKGPGNSASTALGAQTGELPSLLGLAGPRADTGLEPGARRPTGLHLVPILGSHRRGQGHQLAQNPCPALQRDR